MPAEENTGKIQLDPKSTRFFQGVSAGSEVREAHKAFANEPLDVRLGLYWFYVGALAASKFGVKEQEEFMDFIQGASLRKPEPPDPDDDDAEG